ncbi:MAG: HAD hydrolase-like protein [Lachnospiraceae bacterium]|nr:HAD hydrolase-like protein [Lachnospiraceae bacterium]
MIKAVWIDVDNTLLDFDACVKAALRDGFAHFGLPPYRDEMFPVFNRVNNEMWHRLELGELTREELLAIRFDRIFEALGFCFDGVTFEEYFRNYLFDSTIHVDGALSLLRHLADKYVVCAASNGPYEQQIHRLQKAEMYPCMTYCFISEQVGAEKPSQEYFDYGMSILRGEVWADAVTGGAFHPEEKKDLSQLTPDEVMMIGDSLTADMAGGTRYGMKTCWYNPQGKGLPEGMAVDHVVRTLEEIKKFL